MKYYSGYNKPYIYTAFDSSIEERVNEILKPLDDKGVLFWRNNNINKKELNRIEMAFSIIVFVTNDYVKTKEFHDIINHAVKKNKEILTIYLEEVELDAWGHMQLDSLQYLNVSQNDFDSKLLEASIFQDMKVTDAQKRFQRRTTITAIATPILAGVLVFFLIIEPLLIAPTRINNDSLGLNGLTQEELDSITELYIMGDQVYKDEDITKVHCWPHNGSKNIQGDITRTKPDGSWQEDGYFTVNRGLISDISDLAKLRNLKTLCISGQQITDISPIYSLTQLECLGIECNPIVSIEGINRLINLEKLWLSGTDIEDLSPLNGMEKLTDIGFDSTPVKIYPDTETLSHIDNLCVGGTTNIPHIGKHNNNINLDTRSFNGQNVHLSDYSFLDGNTNFNRLTTSSVYLNEILPYIENARIEDFAATIEDLTSLTQLEELNVYRWFDLHHSRNLVTLEGIEHFDGLEGICLKGCTSIQDFYLLNNLKNVDVVIISPNMKDACLSQLKDDVCFEIWYEDE